MNTDVTAGKKANEALSFSAGELSLMGITDIADIELCFYICNEDRDDYLEMGPRQLKTSIADNYDYTVDTYRQTIGNSDLLNSLVLSVTYNSEEEAFSQGGVRIVTQTLATNSDGEPAWKIPLTKSSALSPATSPSTGWSFKMAPGPQTRLVQENAGYLP